MPKHRKIIRKPATRSKSGLSDTTIWRLEKEGKFPKRVQITSKLVGWYEDEIDTWLANPTGWNGSDGGA